MRSVSVTSTSDPKTLSGPRSSRRWNWLAAGFLERAIDGDGFDGHEISFACQCPTPLSFRAPSTCRQCDEIGDVHGLGPLGSMPRVHASIAGNALEARRHLRRWPKAASVRRSSVRALTPSGMARRHMDDRAHHLAGACWPRWTFIASLPRATAPARRAVRMPSPRRSDDPLGDFLLEQGQPGPERRPISPESQRTNRAVPTL